MEDKLYYKDLHKVIEGDSSKPSKINDIDRKKMNRKAIGYIREEVDLNVFHHIFQKTDVHSIWEGRQLRIKLLVLACESKVEVIYLKRQMFIAFGKEDNSKQSFWC